MIKTVFSTKPTILEAVHELKEKFGEHVPRYMFVFGSMQYEPHALTKALNGTFSETTYVGGTAFAQMTNGNLFEHSLIAMGFEDEIKSLHVEIIEELTVDLDQKVKKVLHNLEKKVETPLLELDMQKYFGLTLLDYIYMTEERTMEILSDHTDIPFLGASLSSSDFTSGPKPSFVYANGKAYEGASLVAILETKNGYKLYKSENYEEAGRTLEITRVDDTGKNVVEINGESATEVFKKEYEKDAGRLYGVNGAELLQVGLPTPSGLFVRAGLIDSEFVTFSFTMFEGMELSYLNKLDLIEKTKHDFEENLSKDVKGVLEFMCAARFGEMMKEQRVGEYLSIYGDVPMIAPIVFGEQMIGHLNSTSVYVLFY